MITVQQVIQYYNYFFQSLIYEQVKQNDKIITEWQYFNQLLTKNLSDQNRIQTYLNIINLNNKNQLICQQNKQTPNTSQLNLQTNASSNTIQLNYNDDNNIDTDYDDSSPSSSSSNNNYQNLDKQDNNEEDFTQEEILLEDDEVDNNVMIIERRCFDDELNNFLPDLKHTSNSADIQNNQNEKDDKRKGDLKQPQQNCYISTPNTSKNIQIQKFSFYSNEQPLLTNESINSPVLKEVTSNFQNIKSFSNNNNNNVSQQLDQIQSKPQTQQRSNTQVNPSQSIQNQHILEKNIENNFTQKNEDTKDYNINFKLCQKSKKNEHEHFSFNKIDQTNQSYQFNSYSQSSTNKQTPQYTDFSVSNKTQKNMIQETSLHTKSLEQNMGQMDIQKSAQNKISGNLKEEENGNDFKKRNITQRSLTTYENSNKNEVKLLKIVPYNNITNPSMQHQLSQTNQNTASGSLIQDKPIQEIENKEQSFQVSLNQEYDESVSERKNQIKIAKQKIPFQDNNQLITTSAKPSQIIANESKQKREFNTCLLKKQITETINFFEGNNKSLNDIIDKYQKEMPQQQNYQFQQNKGGQLTLFAGQQQKISMNSNQMTPQSLLNSNSNSHPKQNYQHNNQILKQTNQIQLLFQPTPPPPSNHAQYQIQQQQNSQNPFGSQQTQQSQMNQNVQQYYQKVSSQNNNFSNQNQQNQQQQGIYPINCIKNNQQQFTNIQQASIGRQNVFQPPLIPLKSVPCQRGSFENGGRSISTYSRESTDGQIKTMFKRMRTYDICTNSSISSSIPNNLQNKNLNSTMDENINNSNNISCNALNTSKLNLNLPGQNSNNVSCNLNPMHSENNRYLTNSTNQITYSNQSTSLDQTRKRSEYSFPDLKSFNKHIKKV